MSAKSANNGSGKFLLGCGLLFVLACAFFLFVSILPRLLGGSEKISIGKDKVAVVEVFGPIIDSDEVTGLIEKYAKNGSIKGIIVHIDSPGGAVAPSQEIYEALLSARDKKPVVASFGSVAASGGYYIALGADRIVSNPGTITGSIGVIMGFIDPRELLSKIGLATIIVKSGEFKDIGQPGRAFTDRDRKMLQGVIDDVYGQFVEAVAESREMTIDEVKAIADGRILSGRMAKEVGLVDEIGTFRDSVTILSELAGIDGDPTLIRKKEDYPFLKEIFSEKLSILKQINPPAGLKPGIHYLWTGY
jgi:protease-4